MSDAKTELLFKSTPASAQPSHLDHSDSDTSLMTVRTGHQRSSYDLFPVQTQRSFQELPADLRWEAGSDVSTVYSVSSTNSGSATRSKGRKNIFKMSWTSGPTKLELISYLVLYPRTAVYNTMRKKYFCMVNFCWFIDS